MLTFYPRAGEYLLSPAVTRANLYPSFEIYCQSNDQIADSQAILDAYLDAHPMDLIIPLSYKPNLVAARSRHQHDTVITQTLRNSPWSVEPTFDPALRDAAIIKQGTLILQNQRQADYFDQPKFRHVQQYLVHNPLHPILDGLRKIKYQKVQRIIAVGRLVPHKNQAMMIEAMRILRDEFHYSCSLDIYGAGPMGAELQNLINGYQLQDQVHLCGREIDIFRTAVNYDLFIMTSRHEGTPNALLETMGLGLPVICVDCPTGPSELVEDGFTGYLLPTFDPHALAAKIIEINVPEHLAALGREARASILEKYHLSRTGAELRQCIDALLAQRKSSWPKTRTIVKIRSGA